MININASVVIAKYKEKIARLKLSTKE